MEYSGATEVLRRRTVEDTWETGSRSRFNVWNHAAHHPAECPEIAMRSEETGSEALASGAQLVPFSPSQPPFCYVA